MPMHNELCENMSKFTVRFDSLSVHNQDFPLRRSNPEARRTAFAVTRSRSCPLERAEVGQLVVSWDRCPA